VDERVIAVRSTRGSTPWRFAIIIIVLSGLLAGSNAFEYFTIESNVIVLAYFVLVLVGRRTRKGWAPALRFRGAMTSYILLTGIVYHFVLHNGANPLPGLTASDSGTLTANWSQFLLHYVIPIMVLVDWIAWGPRHRVRWIDGLVWAMYPLGYALVIIVRGLLLPGVDDRYPYPFFDPNTNGWIGVASTLIGLIIIYLVIVVVIIVIDRLLATFDRRELRAE
jgi:hypothetical protein